MDFQLQPGRTKGFAGQLGGKHRLLGIAHAAGVGQQADIRTLHVYEQVVFAIAQLYTLHGYGHHFCAGSFDGLAHDGIGIEFACTKKQARGELHSSQ